MSQPILEMKHIRKCFSSTVALDDVELNVYPGEICGLIGENGSGKSTISTIAAGMQKCDKGEMVFEGQPWNPSSMIDALHKGIGIIVQESGTIPGISVAENIFLAEVDQFRIFNGKNGKRFGPVDRAAMNKAADAVMENIGVGNIRGAMMMGSLDFQTRKLVEIAKVVMKNPQILIVDETTTALSQDGREALYGIMKKYRDEGKGVVFISHDLDEIMEVCDTLTVLRDGRLIRTFRKEEFDADQIRTSMIGRAMQGDYYRSDFTPSHMDEVTLTAEHIAVPGVLDDVSLLLRKGEIVGIGGLSHCGMHNLGKILFGAERAVSGRVITADGTVITNETVAMKQGIGYVAKDRDVESLTLSASIRDNIAIAGMERFAVGDFLVLDRREKEYVDAQIEALSIKCADRDQLVSQLSGGNKQKVVFGKWIGRGADILILDCPTRGVDIGVKRAMYQLMEKLKNEGKSILMISEEMPELIGMSDRLIILKDGRIMKEFERSKDLSDVEIIKYMI
ncbi:MAG: sugar ABC transporter ATP-binding protein [Oscillospiraceae bacterium]|nr:sugar ABC transporter ATP-binding protein [Oscillospiraceae bacterium]